MDKIMNLSTPDLSQMSSMISVDSSSNPQFYQQLMQMGDNSNQLIYDTAKDRVMAFDGSSYIPINNFNSRGFNTPLFQQIVEDKNRCFRFSEISMNSLHELIYKLTCPKQIKVYCTFSAFHSAHIDLYSLQFMNSRGIGMRHTSNLKFDISGVSFDFEVYDPMNSHFNHQNVMLVIPDSTEQRSILLKRIDQSL